MTAWPFQTWFKTTLAAKLNPAVTTITLATAPTATTGRLYLKNWTQEEWISFTGVSGSTCTGLTRTLSQTADPATAGTGLTWIAGTKVKLVQMHDQCWNSAETETISGIKTFSGANTHSGNNTFTGTNTFSSTSKATLNLQQVTTTQRDALTWVANGTIVYNTTTWELNQYIGWAWSAVAAGSTQPDGSTTVAGKFEEATVAEQGTATATGSTGARLVVANANLVKTSSGAWDENKVPVLNSNGQLANRFTSKIGGTWADWAQTDADLTLTWSDNTIITKNFTSRTAGSVARTCTITPANCVVHIKIKWDADFTNWTFNFTGKWWPWWAGWSWFSSNWTAWTVASVLYQSTSNGAGGLWAWNTGWSDTTAWGGGAWCWASGTTTGWWAGWVRMYPDIIYIQNNRRIYMSAWWGWGWGWASWWDAWAWGAGWWALIIEVWGNLTMNNGSTVFSLWWVDWVASSWAWSWGWGGGWGSLVILYNGTLTWTYQTLTISWGSGGAAWAQWDVWGAGWVWLSVIEQSITR